MEDIIKKIRAHQEISEDESFVLAQSVSNLLLIDENKDDGLKLIIYVIDNWELIPESTREIWLELIESAGFYPYIKKLGLQGKDLGFQLRMECHHSTLLDKYFHEGQLNLSQLIFNGQNIVASAPTSFGKSLLIEEIVASKRFKNIVIIQPNLALLDETRQKLTKYKSDYKIIVRTTQSADLNKGNIFLLTAERVLEYENLPQIDFFVLDEFYKLSNKRGDNRSNVLNSAFLKVMKNKYCQFYLLGPNIDYVSEEFLKKYNAKFFHTDYTLVNTETINKYDMVKIKSNNKKVDEQDLFALLDEIDDQTLIFCSSPSTARNLAFKYSKHLEKHEYNGNKNLPLIEWIDANISWGWSLTRCLSEGIGVHDGAMPKHITSSTIRYFNQGQLKYLFCTNTIIEGVNTSAKNVIYYDNKIGNRDVDYFDYSNIKGRAGRLMEHYVGRVINLKQPPEKENIFVDIPMVDQNPIDSDVLVNLEEENVKPINDNRERYASFKALDPQLQEILKRNAVSIEGQLAILQQLEYDVKTSKGYGLICWKRPDKDLHKHIEYILDLCWENLSNKDERKGFGPRGWVRNKIVSICYGDSIGRIIENDINYKFKELATKESFHYASNGDIYIKFPNEAQQIIDEVIEKVFSFQKNWQQYRAPKWINVVDSLQKYVCERNGRKAGDYSYVAEMVENNLIEPSLRILLEYGLPDNAIKYIQKVLHLQDIDLHNISEDELMSLVKQNLIFYEKILGMYEIDILKRIIM